jgi:hypothetical protein
MNNIAGDDQIAFVAAAGTAGHLTEESTSIGESKLGFRDILDVAYKMAQAGANMSNDSQKKHYIGEMIKLSETMNGNVESLEGLSVRICWTVIFQCIMNPAQNSRCFQLKQ